MPTAARLFSAICLAVLGFLVSELIKGVMPERTAFGIFSLLNAGIGAVVGWVVVGSRAGRGLSAGISNGITGTVALVLVGLGVQAINEMVRLAMRNRFDGPVEAFAAIFEIAIEYAAILVDGGIIGLLIVGALITGVVSEFAAKNFR